MNAKRRYSTKAGHSGDLKSRQAIAIVALHLLSFALIPDTRAQIIIGIDGRNQFDPAFNLASGSDFSAFRSQLSGQGYTLVTLTEFGSANLSAVNAVILLQPFDSGTVFSPAEIDAVSAFTANGNGLLVLGDAGGNSDGTFINALASRYGVTYASSGSEEMGHTISSFVPHSITSGIGSIGVDYQRRLTISGSAIDLTPGSGADDFLAVSGRAVLVSDSGMFSNSDSGADQSIESADNKVLLDNIATYITTVPEPVGCALVVAAALVIMAAINRAVRSH